MGAAIVGLRFDQPLFVIHVDDNAATRFRLVAVASTDLLTEVTITNWCIRHRHNNEYRIERG